jgi:hypothetical protein
VADNTTYTEGSGITIATDDISNVHHQRVKVEYGPDGTATSPVPSAGFPVRLGIPTTSQFTRAVVSSTTTAGRVALIAATSSQTARVFRLHLVISAVDSTLKFESATTALTGVMALLTGATIDLDFDGEPHFVTGTNEAFNMYLGSAATVMGWIDYEKS